MKHHQTGRLAGRNFSQIPRSWLVMATLSLSLAVSHAAAPDLTAGGTRFTISTNSQYFVGGQFFTYNLGPTGLRGWIYALGDAKTDSFTSIAPWQIMVTSVDASPPAVGILQNNDVILGAQAGLPPVSLFTNDSRVCLGNAITAAEAGNGQLSFLVNRYDASNPSGPGTNTSVTLQLGISNMAYSATAPYNCPKSALLLSNAVTALGTMSMSRSVALALLASGNNNYLPQLQDYARLLAPTNLVMGWPSYQSVAGGKPTWDMGYNGTFLAEYYMVTNDPRVVHGLTQYILMTAKSSTLYGCYGHGGAVVLPYHVAAGVHGHGVGYGPVNASGLLCNLAVALGQKTGIPGIVTNAEVPAAIARASSFFGYYVNKGAVPYGEMPPYEDQSGVNGKNALAALFFGVQGNRPTEAQYFTRTTLSSHRARETGHSGAGWGLHWDPLGDNVGGTNAAAAFAANTRWQRELARRSDGSYTYDCTSDVTSTAANYGDRTDYHGFVDPTAWNALFLSVPLKKLYITGKNASPTNFINDAAVSNAVWAGQWRLNMAGYTTNQLLAQFSEYDPVVRHWAAQRIAAICVTNATISSAITPQLITLTTNANPSVRSAACDALATLKPASALDPLVARLSDTDVWTRFKASQAINNLASVALPKLTNILSAFVSNAVDSPLSSINWNDPCGWGNGYLAELLFKKLGGITINQHTNLLYPAIRAGLRQPDRGSQGHLNGFLTVQMRWEDVQAVAPELVAASTIPGQADQMWDGTEGAAPACLARFGVEDGIAALGVMTANAIDGRIGRNPSVLGPAYGTYGTSATNLVPLLQKMQTVAGGSFSSIMASYITTLQANPNPPAPRYFKKFTSLTANPSPIGLSPVSNAANAVLRVTSSALDGGVARYTWSVAQGPGPVTFSPNGNVASSNSTALFTVPGTYSLRVMAVNNSILNSNLFWNTNLPGGQYVSGNATWNFSGWTNNYGAIYTNLSVVVWPARASLSNTLPTSLTSSSASLNATLNGALSNSHAVTAFWGTSSGGTNAGLWSNSVYVGSWTNIYTTNLSIGVGGLAGNTTYYYTFRATNAAGAVWATNVLNFRTINPANAHLIALAPSAGTLAPAFVTNTFSYAVNVPYATNSITVTPTPADFNAAVTVNGSPVVSGNPSAPLDLSVGTNLITTVVVSANLAATNTYTLTVTRTAPSSNAYLANLVPSDGTLAPAFASNVFSYSASVPSSTDGVTVTPTAAEGGAAITVNGIPVASGTLSVVFDLSVGANLLETVVVSSDATTTNTYSLVVTRAALPVRWWDGGTTNLPADGDGLASGGAGTWNTTIQNWDQGSGESHVSWNNANHDTAIFNGTPGTVTVGTGITIGGLTLASSGYTITNNTLTFGVASSITNVMSIGATTIGSALAGSAPITTAGAGTLTLNSPATNTFNGGLVLKGGTLLADFANRSAPTDAINSSNNVTLGGGTLSIKGKSSGATSQTLGAVTVNAGGGQIVGTDNGGTSTTINLGLITATNAGGSLLVGNSTTTADNAPIITTTTPTNSTGIHGGRVVFFSGTASTGYDWATTVLGSSPYTLSAYSDYTALPTSGGSATVNYNMTALTTLTGSFSVNTLKLQAPADDLDLGTRTLTIAGGGLLFTGSAAREITGSTGGTRLTAGNGSGAYDLIVHAASSSLTISAIIGNNGTNAVNLVKAGGGALILSGANTYSGKTYVNAGVLHLGTISLSGFGGGSGRNIHVAANTAVLRNVPDNAFLSRIVQTADEITIGTGTDGGIGLVDLSGQNGGTYLPNAFLGNWAGNGAKAEYSGGLTPADDTYRLGSPISSGLLGIITTLDDGDNPRSLVVGGSRVELVAQNTFSGDTLLRTGGRLFIGNQMALQNSALNLGSGLANDPYSGIFSLSAGTGTGPITGDSVVPNPTLGGLKGSRNLLSAYSGSSPGNNASALATSAVTGFTLNVGASRTCTYSGVIGEFATATTLDIVGAGTQVLAGASTYTGGTIIDSGTLLINNTTGSGTGTGSVTVNNGGTLGGTGTISGTVNVNPAGTLSPGTSVGPLTTGSETWNGGAICRFEVSSATNSAGRDLLNINGPLNVSASSGNRVIVKLVSLANPATPGLVPDFNPSTSYTWAIATASGGILNFDPDKFDVDVSAFANALTGNFSVGVQGNSLVLNYSPALIPPVLISYGPLSGGSFPLTFSGPSGQSYKVLTSPNLTLPLSLWTTLSSGVFGPSPVSYTNTTATNALQFYLIQSP